MAKLPVISPKRAFTKRKMKGSAAIDITICLNGSATRSTTGSKVWAHKFCKSRTTLEFEKIEIDRIYCGICLISPPIWSFRRRETLIGAQCFLHFSSHNTFEFTVSVMLCHSINDTPVGRPNLSLGTASLFREGVQQVRPLAACFPFSSLFRLFWIIRKTWAKSLLSLNVPRQSPQILTDVGRQ